MKRIKIFMSLSWQAKTLLFESYFYLGWARILKSFPFSKVAPSLGDQMTETAFSFHAADKKKLARISQAIHMISPYTFWESQCLVKAIAAMKMLERRNLESTLYLGTAKDKSGNLSLMPGYAAAPFILQVQRERKILRSLVNLLKRFNQT